MSRVILFTWQYPLSHGWLGKGRHLKFSSLGIWNWTWGQAGYLVSLCVAAMWYLMNCVSCMHCTVGWRSGGASLWRHTLKQVCREGQSWEMELNHNDFPAPLSSSFLRKVAFFLLGFLKLLSGYCTINKCVPPVLLSSQTAWDSVSCTITTLTGTCYRQGHVLQNSII